MRRSNGRAFQQLLRCGTSVGANYREGIWRSRQSRMEPVGRATYSGQPRGSGERAGDERINFIAKCGDCLREIERNRACRRSRSMDVSNAHGSGRSLMGSQRVKRLAGWNAGRCRDCSRREDSTGPPRMRRAHRHLRHHPEALEAGMISFLHSSFLLLPFLRPPPSVLCSSIS